MTTIHIPNHVKNHAVAYALTLVTAAISLTGLLAWDGVLANLDDRHITRVENTKQVETFTTGQQDILKIYQTTEIESGLRAVKKDLSRARRDKRRFEAYLSADPNSALFTARQQTVNELNDEVSELEEEREELLEKAAAQ